MVRRDKVAKSFGQHAACTEQYFHQQVFEHKCNLAWHCTGSWQQYALVGCRARLHFAPLEFPRAGWFAAPNFRAHAHSLSSHQQPVDLAGPLHVPRFAHPCALSVVSTLTVVQIRSSFACSCCLLSKSLGLKYCAVCIDIQNAFFQTGRHIS